jgi:hypothetical protein
MNKPIQDKKALQEENKQKLIYIVFNFFLILGSMIFALWWQDAYTIKAVADGIWLVFALQLTIAWSFFVYNRNIFTPLLHGAKTFVLLFIGRKPKEDYYTAYTKIIDNPLPKYLIRISFAFLLLIGVIGYLATVIAYA